MITAMVSTPAYDRAQDALAERCSQPTITNHVERLEAAHLVDRAPNPRDARAWMIKLTKKGYQQLDVMRLRSVPPLSPTSRLCLNET
jgi:hypothetical protein